MKRHRSRQPKASQNPSPSGDPWYDVPENLAHVREAVEEYKRNKDDKGVITFHSVEEIDKFFRELEDGM